jgi:hypothetical protein
MWSAVRPIMSPALSMTAMFLLACAPPLDVSDASTSVVASATSPEATAACSDGGMTAATCTFDDCWEASGGPKN